MEPKTVFAENVRVGSYYLCKELKEECNNWKIMPINNEIVELANR